MGIFIADNIPRELTAYRQWILWAYQERDGKRTKVPLTPTGALASVTDPQAWVSFDEAVAAAPRFAGIGFVFTEHDPFVGIDLDDATGDPAVTDVQMSILASTQSYAERSPSGMGCHIIAKAKLKGGRRKGKLEIYGSGRFFTMTGDRIEGQLACVLDAQKLVDEIYASLGGQTHETSYLDYAGQSTASDADLLNGLRTTKHSERFNLLFAGAWGAGSGFSPHCGYPSQSEGDQALYNIIANRTRDPEQIRRLFNQSALGHRFKATRDDYHAKMLNRAFDRHMPTGAVEAAKESVNRALARLGPLTPPKRMNGHHAAPALVPIAMDAEIISVRDIPIENVRWLWVNWLARKKLHILAGDPEAGKTTLAMSMAAILSKGGMWPDGTIASPGKVLIWTGEDDLADTIVPRLHKMGANLDNIFVVKGVRDPGTNKLRAFRPSTDMPYLAQTIEKIGMKFDFIIIDPLVAVQAGRGKANDNVDTREALTILTDFALEQEAAILGIHHNTKGSSGRKLVERIAGSLALGAVARTTFFACKNERHQDDPSEPPRIFGRSKSNIGAPVSAYGYEILFGPIPDHPYADATHVNWLQPIEGDLQTVVDEAEEKSKERPEGHAGSLLEEARRWLAENMGAMERPANEIIAQAEKDGVKPHNIRKVSMEICDKRKDGLGAWYWRWKAAPKPKN